MKRTLLSLVVAASLLAAAQPATAATAVGIGEQHPGVFSDPLLRELGVSRARVIVPWNVAAVPAERQHLDDWLSGARAAGVKPLVTFGAGAGSRCPRSPCRLPSVSAFSRAFRAFRRRWPSVREISPWNEANHRSQPTMRSPKRAAQFYNAVRARCRGCKIVAADVIDEANMVRWVKTFRRHARRPSLWGLHNYRDTNRRPGQVYGGTARLLRTVRGKVWLTETGGIVKFQTPEGGMLFPFSEQRARQATDRMFRLARRYRSRIARLYVYHWLAPDPSNRFDAGLVRPDGTPRPAYFTFKRQLATRYFAP